MTAGKPPVGKRQQDLVQDLIDEATEDPWLNLTSVAKILHVHPSTVSRWCDEGIMKSRVIGKLPKVKKSDLIAFLENTEIPTKQIAQAELEPVIEGEYDGN